MTKTKHSTKLPSACVFLPDPANTDYKGQPFCGHCGFPEINRRHDPDLLPAPDIDRYDTDRDHQ